MSTQGSLTSAELESRRANAKKSTGPRTPRGKRFARMNATRHGAYSTAFRETLLALKEDPDEYARLLARLLGAFSPPKAISRGYDDARVSDGPAGDDGRNAACNSEPNPLVALAIEELAELHWELERERRIHHLLHEERGWHRAQDLESMTEVEEFAFGRTERRQDYLRAAIDRKLRVILALAREARQEEKSAAKREPGIGGELRVGPPEAAGRRSVPNPSRLSSPAANLAGTAANPVGTAGTAESRPALQALVEDVKNEGTNRGSPVESANGAVS